MPFSRLDFQRTKVHRESSPRIAASMKSQQLQSTHQALPRALVPPALRESAINRAACFLTGKRFRKTTCRRVHHTRGHRTDYSARPFPLMSLPPTPSSPPTSSENGSFQNSIDSLATSENEAGAFHQICRSDRSLTDTNQLTLVWTASSVHPQNRI